MPWSLTEEEELLAQKLEDAAQEMVMAEALKTAQLEAEAERILREQEAMVAEPGRTKCAKCHACGQAIPRLRLLELSDDAASGDGSSNDGESHTTAPRTTTPESSRSQNLAKGWSEAVDPESGDTYYYSADGETTWEKPVSREWSSATTTPEETPPASARSCAVPEGWETARDPETGDRYFFSRDLGTSTWDKPRTAPLPRGWEELVDSASGDRYYANVAKGVTQWDRPQV